MLTRTPMALLALIILLSAGCAKKLPISSEKEYWSQVKSVKNLPVIKLENQNISPIKMKILARKLAKARSIRPPARLSANNDILKKEKRELLNTIPPKKISYLRQDFLRIFLTDEEANNLYADAMRAEDKNVVERLVGLSTKYSNSADRLLTKSLLDLSIKTGHKNRWRFN